MTSILALQIGNLYHFPDSIYVLIHDISLSDLLMQMYRMDMWTQGEEEVEELREE